MQLKLFFTREIGALAVGTKTSPKGLGKLELRGGDPHVLAEGNT